MKKRIRSILAAVLVIALAMCLLTGCYTTADFGYIDTQGNWVLEPGYQQAYPFHDGLAVAMWGIEGSAFGYGLIDHEGQYHGGDRFYSAMRGYYDGILVAQDQESENWGYYDLDGNNLFGKEFHDASVFSLDLAPAATLEEGNLYGYIAKDGNWVIEPQFDLASVFDEESGLAMVRRGGENTGKYGFINTAGELVIDYSYSYAGSFAQGYAPIKKSTISGALDWGFIDPTGTIVYEAQDWGYCRGFSEGMAAVCIGDPNGEEALWGYIGLDGQWVIEPQFKDALSFSEGLAAVNFGEETRPEWGYITPAGELVIEAIYESAGQFSEGLAPVYDYDYR